MMSNKQLASKQLSSKRLAAPGKRPVRVAMAEAAPVRVGLAEIFGPPPLLEGEDADGYHELRVRILAAVKPSGILEEIWARDVVDLTWEALRLRRFKTRLVRAGTQDGLERLLRPFAPWDEAKRLAAGWAARDGNAMQMVDAYLASAGLTVETVMAEGMSVRLDDIERIDRMLAAVEMRRNAVLHEVERHRATLGRLLRRAAEEVEDAEFETVAAEQAETERPGAAA